MPASRFFQLAAPDAVLILILPSKVDPTGNVMWARPAVVPPPRWAAVPAWGFWGFCGRTLDGTVLAGVSGRGIRRGLVADTSAFWAGTCLLYTSPSPRDRQQAR